MTQQLTTFLENRSGRVQEVTRILAEAGINILSFNLADTTSFGVLRMIVSDAMAGKSALKQAGISCQITEVLEVDISQDVGSMYKLLLDLPEGYNVEYMYPIDRNTDQAGMVLKLDDPVAAGKRLKELGYQLR